MPDVRFGSKADMCSAKGYVRFAPKSGHGSAERKDRLAAVSPKSERLLAPSASCAGQTNPTRRGRWRSTYETSAFALMAHILNLNWNFKKIILRLTEQN